MGNRAADLHCWMYFFDTTGGANLINAEIRCSEDGVPKVENLPADTGCTSVYTSSQGNVYGQKYDTVTGAIVDP